MKHNLLRKFLDIFVSVFLLLLLIFSFIFRSSPIDFMNPGFPILRGGDVRLSEKFLLLSQADPLRLTEVHDFGKVTYETTFQVENKSLVFPNGSPYHGTQTLTRFSNVNDVEKALHQSYQEYSDYEGDFPIPITNIPLKDFVSKADYYLLWCGQYSKEPIFDAGKINTCYYWAVYGLYLSQFRLFVSRGGDYPLDLFIE